MRMLYVAALLVLCACIQRSEVAATQVMLRVYASPEVQASSFAVRVRLATFTDGRWHETSSETLSAEDLSWPFDLSILPGTGKAEDGKFFVLAEALGKDGTSLVEARVITNFVPHRAKLLPLQLVRCGQSELGK